jgi:hypothetical protein
VESVHLCGSDHQRLLQRVRLLARRGQHGLAAALRLAREARHHRQLLDLRLQQRGALQREPR